MFYLNFSKYHHVALFLYVSLSVLLSFSFSLLLCLSFFSSLRGRDDIALKKTVQKWRLLTPARKLQILEWVCVCEKEREIVCVCVCVCVSVMMVCVCERECDEGVVCMCDCVWYVCVCVCVCVDGVKKSGEIPALHNKLWH